MITKMRPRYYCEYCGKGNGSPSFMKKHEAGCTKNIQRVCGMCATVEVEQVPHEELKKILDTDGFNAMVSAANECPACILSVIRLYNIVDKESGELTVTGPDDGRKQWKYDDCKKQWWDSYNAEKYSY